MSKATPKPPSFAALVQAFFAEHLQQQRAMSPRTVATYRDAFVLFLDFAKARLHKQPTAIRLHEITPKPAESISLRRHEVGCNNHSTAIAAITKV